MIVGADKRVSSAFLATLREEPSSIDLAAAFARKEQRGGAILTVSGLTHAIARAEEHMRERVRTTRASNPDIFDALAATDDCVGPALYQPYIPTPIPPPPSADETLVMPRISTLPPPPSMMVPAPILVLDRQAFYHPAGPIPGFAARPPRRGALGWTMAACTPLLALIVLAAFFAVARPWQPKTTALPAAPAKMEALPPVEPVADPPKPAAIPEEPAVLVVDVKTLKAPTKPRSHR